MPEGLSDLGMKAYNEVMRTLNAFNKTYTGGCKAFYSPQEWKDRGEKYGLKSHLIVVYDGGDLSRFFNSGCAMMDGFRSYEFMISELKYSKLYFEECTNWYSAIYEI